MDQDDYIKQQKNPREDANFFSIAFFWWMNSLLRSGYKKDLEIEDLYAALKKDESKFLGDKLERNWKKELTKRRKRQADGVKYTPSLMKALLKTFGPYFAFLGLFVFIEEAFIRIFQPVFMGLMIEYFSDESNMSRESACLYGSGVVALSAAYTFTHHPYFFGVMHTGMKLRISTCSLIYRKALRLSNSALGKTTVGQMVNLLSNDVNRFDQSVLFIHYLWAGPVQLAIVTVILWTKIGPSSLVGVFLLILFVPLQSWIGKQFSRLRVLTAGKTDKRIRIMNEIINGMKVIKMYTWEKSFAELVEDARRNEIGIIRTTAYYRAFQISFFFTASRFILLCTFLVYGFTGEVLTAEKAFLTLSMCNTIRLSMTLFFPLAISLSQEARVSVARIQSFLLNEERDESGIKHEDIEVNGEIIFKGVGNENVDGAVKDTNEGSNGSGDAKATVVMTQVSGKWNHEETENTLTDVSLSIYPGKLVAVIGPVGSGKGSILQAILGELPTHFGHIRVHGKLSYAAQEPWVFSGSIRQNILFGQPLDELRYQNVVEACALQQDLASWEYGDQTLVGERGVALSGGQKARVNLARTIYREADTYLLDDPLSAVDAHVGKHLFDKCIRGFLKSSAVILVTHQLQYLQKAHQIIVLKQGHIEETGTFQYLVKNGMDFSSFLAEEDDPEEIEFDDIAAPEEKKLLPTNKGALLRDRRTPQFTRQLSIRSRTLSIVSEVSTISAIREEFSVEPWNSGNTDEQTKLQNQKKPTEVKESRSEGSVKLKVYTDYFKSGGSWFSLLFMILINILCQVLFTGSDIWISYWTSQEKVKLNPQSMSSNDTLLPLPPNFHTNASLQEFDPEANETQHYFNLGIYAAIVVGLCIASMARTFYYFFVSMRASVNLHNSMFNKIIRAPCRFFDVNPIGRILNRFSKDMGAMDELLPSAFFDVISIALNIAGIMAVIFALRPWVILPSLFLGVIFLYLRKFYMSSARDIKRLEGVSRSPVFSQLSTSLHGLTTIRAFSAEAMLQEKFDKQQDVHTSAWFAFIAGTRWFGVWLDWIVVMYLGAVVFSFLVVGNDLEGGEVGLAISSCIMLTGMLQWCARQSAEVENLMTSVERVMEYSELDEEDEAIKDNNRPPSSWPQNGVIHFEDVYLRYDKDENFVLNGVNFKMLAREKIGIVGRTGAGKSSLVVALFRLAEPTGSIKIDGIDVLSLGLDDLRSKVSIIPQEPLLFTGTLRRNLDPFCQHTDDQVWNVLHEVHLAEAVTDLKNGLDTEMSEGGSNLSVGQRQLVCLARAILKKNNILVLDEATANVDPRTDALIQERIRTRFKECTVITIAHRLHTIMDCDRILVMDKGRVVEFGVPYDLMADPSGVLSELASQTGESSKQRLMDIARNKYFSKINEGLTTDHVNIDVIEENKHTIVP